MKKSFCLIIIAIMIGTSILFFTPNAFSNCGKCGVSSAGEERASSPPFVVQSQAPVPNVEEPPSHQYSPSIPNVSENLDADGNLTKIYRNAKGQVTRTEEINKDGSTVITDYDPDAKIGMPRSRLETYPTGYTKSDTRYDTQLGEKISELTYYDDGKLKSEERLQPDETYRKSEYELDGNRRESVTSSDDRTNGVTYDKDNNIKETFKKIKGVDAEKTIHNLDGSKNHFDYYSDGSVKNQTKIKPDGTEDTKSYEPGKYIEENGKVKEKPAEKPEDKSEDKP